MSAVHKLITDHLDIWTAADTEKKSGRGRASGNANSVYGIKKLRELILELAVRGKLVPQDPNDEPAGELLKRIHIERANSISNGKTKKEKLSLPIEDEEKTFELPENWEWIRLSKIAEFVNGFAFSSSDFSNEGVGVVKIGDIQDGSLTPESMSRVPFEVVRDLDVRLKVEPNELVIAMSGATTGKLGFNKTSQTFYLNQRVGKIIPFIVSREFLFLDLTTKIAANLAKSFGSAIPNLSTEQINAILIALPPLAEQHRIVAKVDELMALCDQLEAQHNNAADAHEQLVSHLLSTLTQSQDAEDFNANWQRIATHFDTLFTTESSIDALKQTLLQLAVMGKLVPQDPNDEPASELLKRIQAEKAKLISEGKIKKDKSLPEIGAHEIPFGLPNGWQLARLNDLTKLITKGSSPKWQGVNYSDNHQDILFVTSENVGSYTLLLDSPKYVEQKFNEIEPRSILAKGDFLMNIVGASIGRTAIYNLDTLANINQAVCLIRALTSNLYEQFLLHFFNSDTCLQYMFDKQVDNARPNLSMGNIAKFVVPLPPLAEQHRIVAKITELMTHCEQLKSRINHSRSSQQKLADVLIETAVQ
jgi:type I restriction enzyme S subunit